MSQSVRIPLLPAENKLNRESLGLREEGGGATQLSLLLVPNPPCVVLDVATLAPWAHAQSSWGEILEQLISNISNSDM